MRSSPAQPLHTLPAGIASERPSSPARAVPVVQQRAEQRRRRRHRAAALRQRQRRMLVAQQLRQRRASRRTPASTPCSSTLHPHRQRVDEQPQHPLRALATLHPPEQHRAEHHILAPAHPRQHLRPRQVAQARRTHPKRARLRSQAARSSPRSTLSRASSIAVPVALHIHQPKRRRRLVHVPQQLAGRTPRAPPRSRPSRACATKFRNGSAAGSSSPARPADAPGPPACTTSSVDVVHRSGDAAAAAAASARSMLACATNAAQQRRLASRSSRWCRGSKRSRNCSLAPPSRRLELDLLHRQRRLAPHHLHRLATAPPTPPPCARCRAGRSPPAARSRYRSKRCPAVKAISAGSRYGSPFAAPSGGETGSLPAAAPAGRCPGRWPTPPGTAATIRSISCWLSSTSGSISGVIASLSPRIRLGGTTTSALRRPRVARQLRQRRRREQRAHVRVQPRAPHPLDQLHRQQRMPAQLEEVVVPAHPLHAQQLRPELRPASASTSPSRRLVRPRAHTASPSGAGSALRSSLPFGVSGSASSRTNAAGTMYSGKRAAQVRSQRRPRPLGLRPRCLSFAACTYATSRLSARAVLARQHHRLAHRRHARQPRLDLPQLDPEAAHLHLIVVAPQELDRPVRAATAPGRRSGTSARPLAH